MSLLLVLSLFTLLISASITTTTSTTILSTTLPPSNNDLTGGEIAAIVIGSIAGIIVLGLIIYGIYRQCGVTSKTPGVRHQIKNDVNQSNRRYHRFKE